MARLPFSSDPRDEAPASPARPARGDRDAMTVGELSARIKAVLAGGFPAKIRVAGEISNFSDRSHWFFSLKDADASIRCVCFASAARRMGFVPEDGMAVIAIGRVDYYDAQGSLQLYVDKLEPAGQGTLEMQFRALCEELRKLGYFDDDHKQLLPTMPERIAIVTSRAAAALQDVIKTAHSRWPGCELALFDVRVQGEDAAAEIAEALDALSSHGKALGIDAIILTRGGGSIEDLWAFNERIVADSIYRCALPIVAAIGHETDTTIAELVADHRCSTPTQAAMTLVPDRAALEHQVRQLGDRLTLLTKRRIDIERQRLRTAAKHPALLRPDRMLQPVRLRLDELVRRLHTGMRQSIAERKQGLAALSRHLKSVGPQNVLERGYSYTTDEAGRIVRSAASVNEGDPITTVLADGRIGSRVETVDTGGGSAVPKRKRNVKKKPKKAKTKRESEEPPGLFE